jgi:hypothetical protein
LNDGEVPEVPDNLVQDIDRSKDETLKLVKEYCGDTAADVTARK